MSPQQKAAIKAARFISAAVILGGIVMFFQQESERTIRHCFEPGCKVDPMPWGGLAIAVVAAVILAGTFVYTRALIQASRRGQPVEPPRADL